MSNYCEKYIFKKYLIIPIVILLKKFSKKVFKILIWEKDLNHTQIHFKSIWNIFQKLEFRKKMWVKVFSMEI